MEQGVNYTVCAPYLQHDLRYDMADLGLRNSKLQTVGHIRRGMPSV